MKYLLLALGGAAGTLLRYYLINSVQTNSVQFPWGTFAVNLTGSFVIGLIAGLVIEHSISEEWRLFVFAGLLGGFTTFSSLALETFYLLKSGRFLIAAFYMISTNIIGLLLAITGFWVSKKILLQP